MRHGESLFNQVREESRRYNPELIDAKLSEEGIKQAKSRQEDLNKLEMEKVYVSPYKRALEKLSKVQLLRFIEVISSEEAEVSISFGFATFK